jgi:CubicO group peptidase (beta-lactamase class C family)
MSPVVAAITLRQLLTMQSGLPADLRRATHPWFVDQPSWAGAVLGGGLSGNPTQFSYTTANAQLVAAALHDATGRSLRAYAERHLFRPLGIDRPVTWPLGRTGEDVAFGGLELDARELLRLGELYLGGGAFDGHRVLGARWVREATSDQQFELDPGGYGYGYLWWVKDFGGHLTYAALGEGPQLLEVVPDLGLVVVAIGDLAPDFGLDGAALQNDLDAALLGDS